MGTREVCRLYSGTCTETFRPCAHALSAAAGLHFPARVGAGFVCRAADARPARMVSGAPLTPVIDSMAGGVAVGAVPVVTTLGRRNDVVLWCVRVAMPHCFNRGDRSLVQRRLRQRH